MYLIFIVTIILLILLFNFFDLEANITIISCIIIILLLNSLFYKKTYEKFNNINKLHNEYNNAFDWVELEYKNRNKLHSDKYKMISIYSSKFNNEIFESNYHDEPIRCKGILFNNEYLSGNDFTALLNKLDNINKLN
jgi:hypothetical protein